MSASHPSIFELRHFAVTGELDERHVPHVSGCTGCSGRLQRLARTELTARGFGFEAAAARPTLSAAMPAFLAVAATMLVLAVVRPVVTHGLPFSSSDLTSVDPEGVHGIPSERLIVQAPAWGDGGSAPGSE